MCKFMKINMKKGMREFRRKGKKCTGRERSVDTCKINKIGGKKEVSIWHPLFFINSIPCI